MCFSRCRPGFIGPLCQHLDPCHRSPCLNGAACKSQVVNGIPQYTCVCQRGFRGMSFTVDLWRDQIWERRLKVPILTEYHSLINLQAKTVPSLMPVPQVLVPMGPDVPIGITTTTVPAHLASRERTAAMTLTSAASLACASMVASALTPMGPSIASANLDTVGAHVRCPPSHVPHLSASMEAPVDRPVTIPTSVLAYQVN